MNTTAKSKFHFRHLAGLAVLAGTLLLSACGGGGDGGRDPILGGGGTAILIPAVTTTSPLPNATGVPVNTSVITAAFNKAMDASTITASTFTLACPATAPITGTVSYTTSGSMATMTLGNNLPGNTVCRATISAAVKDDTGNTLAAAHVWTFTTGTAVEIIPPTVSSTFPRLNATAVATNRRITASFSEAMNPLTIIAANMSVACPVGTAVTGTVDYAAIGNVATFTPAQNLPNNTVCRVTISTGVRDVAGNAMKAPFIWNFTTSSTVDTTPPTVISTLPISNATQVPFNSLISATFSEGMTPLSLTTTSFTVECPALTPVTGSVGYAVNGNVATFTPNANLPANTLCRGTITTGVKDLVGLAMAANYTWNFNTGPGPDTTPPTVSSTVPSRNATNVAINTLVTASFSEPMNPLTITTANFTVACPATTPVTGIVGYVVNGNVATFTPASTLPPSTICRATITTGVKDVAGNAKTTVYTWDFTTGLAPDTTKPQVTLTVPLRDQTGVALNTLITARFSEPMDPLTITPPGTFRYECPAGTPGTGIVSYAVNSRVATLTPSADLPGSTTCRATITTDVTDVAGNAMASLYTWDFTTGSAPEVIPPTVTLVIPAEFATGVALNATVNATFSEAMNPLTVSTASFTLQGAGPLLGQVNYDLNSHIATFTPDDPLLPGTTYTATVTNAVEDLTGNNMVVAKVWTFSTGNVLAPGALDLGDASTFGIMATAAITSTGATFINGDVSLDPGTSVGLLPAQVNGSIHVNDGVSQAARDDLLAAHAAGFGLAPGVTIAPGADLGALYPTGIPPGTYTSGSTMNINTVLTLDAGGDPNAVWVFQIGSSLTTTAGGDVMLSPAAQAKNVFFVTMEDATIGVGTTFNGNIIGGRDTTALTGATINGRILTGAITDGTLALQGNVITVPAP